MMNSASSSHPSSELLQPAKELVLAALLAAYEDHWQRGTDGTNEMQTNQFGDRALAGDWEAEERVIEKLRQSGLPIRIISEEHGDVFVNGATKSSSLLVAVLDGLDGSSVYKKAPLNGRYGTM